ncbi:class I SAM-dependent methyltransferase [Maridesulfovibrio hydrothermalis]|uniref:Methyltransferase domain-containing protein n=1 Tax=Maridesulfovibrio hydrothermalis AM13 = DSM 14728 TaxID=1121451 RepID=L0R790_9BACT|nr:methyltransferase domain-containing protein [Maridesulfovibrio hydrothermalis]CCO22588.1 protein of unknown function [Maridesulfovibrio hydrothermalis AM13 = DSM 14728]
MSKIVYDREIEIRVRPSIDNYFIGDQYACQTKCITEGFWTPERIVAEVDNGSRPVLDWALTQLNLQEELSVLDIGCGPSQKMAQRLGKYDNISITGLDSAEAVALSRHFNPSGTYHECDLDSDVSIAQVSAQMSKFDVVFCFDVIEHVLYPEKMLKLIKEHSHEKTKIYITTLERDLSQHSGDLTSGSVKSEHVREWNVYEFSKFIEYMGFVIDKVKITPMKNDQRCQTLLCSI